MARSLALGTVCFAMLACLSGCRKPSRAPRIVATAASEGVGAASVDPPIVTTADAGGEGATLSPGDSGIEPIPDAGPRRLDAGLDTARPSVATVEGRYCQKLVADEQRMWNQLPPDRRELQASLRVDFCLPHPGGSWALVGGEVKEQREDAGDQVSVTAERPVYLLHRFPDGTVTHLYVGAHVLRATGGFALQSLTAQDALDMDGDGVHELMVATDLDYHEPPHEHSAALFTVRKGAIVSYPFAKGYDLRAIDDIDNDGRMDLVVPAAPYDRIEMISGPAISSPVELSLAAHALANGAFDRQDAAARAFLARQCDDLERQLMGRDVDPSLDRFAAGTRIACRRARGESREALDHWLRSRCRRFGIPDEDETRVCDKALLEVNDVEPPLRIGPAAPVKASPSAARRP